MKKNVLAVMVIFGMCSTAALAESAYSHAWRSLNNIHADHSITSMPITQ
ncbi:hypothetical protein ACQZQZ_04560 [Aeromonas salmonicida subsp. pectinolytica]